MLKSSKINEEERTENERNHITCNKKKMGQNVLMFRWKFICLLLLIMHFALWIDGIEARQQHQQQQQQRHDEQQINEAGHLHHQHHHHHNRGSSSGSSSSYEMFGGHNNNKKHHNNKKNNYKENMHKSNGHGGKRRGNSSADGVGLAEGTVHGGRKGENKQRRAHHRKRNRSYNPDDNISLWINEQQLKMLTALFFPHGSMQGRLYGIQNGHVLNDIQDGRLYEYLVIPPEVNHVNFTWKSGHRKYFYNFDLLQSMDENILKAPTISIKTEGRVPKEEKNFSVFLPCNGNISGTAMFNVGLTIHNRSGNPLPGTPLRLNFKKECAHRGPDPECHLKCGEHGYCNHRNICQCHSGYIGQYCEKAFCFPQCMNGGNCTAPSVCSCPDGYQGTQCEGGK